MAIAILRAVGLGSSPILYGAPTKFASPARGCRKTGLADCGLRTEVGLIEKRSTFIESFGAQFYYVTVRVHDVESRPTGRDARALFHPLKLIVGFRAEALGKKEPPHLGIISNAKREMDVSIVDPFALAESRVLVCDEMKLTVAHLVPGARRIG